ncbi:Zinc finger CCCH-type [Trinorchestia longiramus]|nr:Zinc finger CCCH-type [Trinorchestia longiramus]
MSSAVRSEVSKPDDELELYDKGMPELSVEAQCRSLSRSASHSPRANRSQRSPEEERRGYSPARQSSPARRFIRPVSGNYGSAGGNNNPRAPVIDVLCKFPMTCHFWKNNSCIRGAEKCSYIHGFVCRDDPNCKRGNTCRDVHVKLQRFQKNNSRDQRGRVFDHKPGYGVGYRRDDGYMRQNRGGRGNFHPRRFQREDHRPFHESAPRRSRERDTWNDEYRRNQAEHRGRERLRSRSREDGFVRHRSMTPHDEKFDRYRSRSLSRDGRTQRNKSRSLSRERNERYGSHSSSPDKRSYRSQSRSPKRSRSRSRSPSRERRRSSSSSSRSSSSSSRDESFRTGKHQQQSRKKLMDSIKAKNKDTSAEPLKTKGRRHDKDHEESRRAPLFPISVPPMAPPPPKVSAKDLDSHVPPPPRLALRAGVAKDMWTPAMDRPSYDPKVTGVALSRWEIETPLLHR